jgi:hypothetical protein
MNKRKKELLCMFVNGLESTRNSEASSSQSFANCKFGSTAGLPHSRRHQGESGDGVPNCDCGVTFADCID